MIRVPMASVGVAWLEALGSTVAKLLRVFAKAIIVARAASLRALARYARVSTMIQPLLGVHVVKSMLLCGVQFVMM